jgi:hypothetical protein
VIKSANLALLLDGIRSQEPVAGLTHSFYKYPARFSPVFTRAAIQAFTRPGDVVYDPFMGSGTTLVEATALGRRAVGSDINSLGVFLSRVKTTVLTHFQLLRVKAWVEHLIPKLNVWAPVHRAGDWAELGYQRNINSRETWRIRKLVEIAVAETRSLKTEEEQRFARCIILRTTQWALDCRKDIPSVSNFRHRFRADADEMVLAARQYARSVRQTSLYRQEPGTAQASCLHRSAVGVEGDVDLAQLRPVKLVLTSPPYPGVHVLYHRWQVLGRRETPAPFWIAATLDGNGASYYTFGDRKATELDSYYEQALAAFSSISQISARDTMIVQMIAFSEPSWQLPRYLKTMEQAGLKEVRLSQLAADSSDGRIWRSVPNRKWYASQRGSLGSSNEVVLFHRRR